MMERLKEVKSSINLKRCFLNGRFRALVADWAVRTIVVLRALTVLLSFRTHDFTFFIELLT